MGTGLWRRGNVEKGVMGLVSLSNGGWFSLHGIHFSRG